MNISNCTTAKRVTCCSDHLVIEPWQVYDKHSGFCGRVEMQDEVLVVIIRGTENQRERSMFFLGKDMVEGNRKE